MGEVVPLRPGSASSDSPDIRTLLPSWRLALDLENKSPGTIRSYTDSVRMLAEWLTASGHPTGVEDVAAEHLRRYLAARQDATSPGNADKDRRNLSVFWRWCIREDERTPPSPMDRVGRIKVPPKSRPILASGELTTLVKVCSGADWESKRDLAIVRILVDNGMRVSGLAGLRYTPDEPKTNDVFLSRHRLRITLKAGREFYPPIGKKAAAAIDRYIRARARRPHADSPWLWLPTRGRATSTGDVRLTASGIAQMLERRGDEAGIAGVHPHRFRHTFGATWEGDAYQLMDIGGWESLEMARLYSRAGREERAREAHARLSPGDRI